MTLSQCLLSGRRRRLASWFGVAACTAAFGCSSFGGGLKERLEGAAQAELKRTTQDLRERAVAEGRSQLGQLGESATRIATDVVADAVEQQLDTGGSLALRAGSHGPSSVVGVNDRSSRDWTPEARVAAGEAVSARETNELTALLLSRIAAHGVASARLCELQVRRDNAQEEIRQERAAEKYSGVVKQEILHAAGRTMVLMDSELEKLRTDMERKLKLPPTPCAGALHDMASCMASGASCAQEVEDIRRAFVHVDARFRGTFSDKPERELRAKMDTLRLRGAEYRAVNGEQFLRM